MEYLDIYDEQGNFLGKEERSIVHRDALWHKTIHCWLYDKEGNIYFQIRKKENQLYTTASGHIIAGESVTEGFGREIKEEIGVNIDINKAQLVAVVPFQLDREEKDGSLFRDRAFANVYVCPFEEDYSAFVFVPDELNGLAKVNAKDTLELLKLEKGKINGVIITNGESGNLAIERKIDFKDFLVNKGETAIGKYGDVLNKIIELVKS